MVSVENKCNSDSVFFEGYNYYKKTEVETDAEVEADVQKYDLEATRTDYEEEI